MINDNNLDWIREQALVRIAPTRRKQGRNQRTDVAPDPVALRAQLQELLATGRRDICIGYWRTSTIHQTDAYGKDAQLQGVAVLAQTHNKVPDMIIWDVDSGAEESRIGIDILKEAIASGQIGNIYCHALGRLSRDEFLSAEINKLCDLHKTRIYSASENIPDGPAGVAFRGMVQVFNIWERLVIKSRMSEAKVISIQRHGTYSGGNVPFGYRWRPTTRNTGEANLVIDDWEAAVVRLIFSLFAIGYPYGAIARWLNRQQIPTKYGGKRGWKDVQVRRIIESEAQYRAEALFSRKYSADVVAHEPILEHRSDPATRTYLITTVTRLPNGTQIPDDPTEAPAPKRAQQNTVATMTYEQAVVLVRLFSLRDGGLSQQKAANELNKLGLATMRAQPWNQVSVDFYEDRREQAEGRIAEMGWTFEGNDCITAAIDDIVRRKDEGERAEREAKKRIRQLHRQGMGLRRIAATVNAEGHRTRHGNEWHGSTVGRALKGRTKGG